MKKLILLVGVIVLITVFQTYNSQKPAIPDDVILTQDLSGINKPAGLSTYNLSGAGISSSATSLSLSTLTLPQNDYPIQDADLSDIFHMTLEPGSTDRQEFISCTTVGTNTGGSVTISGCK